MNLSQFRKSLFRDDVSEIPLIGGLFPRGFYSVVASSAGVGKSWLMQRIACQLSVGGVVLGGLAEEEKPRKVLIFSGETGTQLLSMRLGRTNWGFNDENISVYSSLDMGIAGVPYLLETEEGKDTAHAIFSTERPDIVYYDTLISWHTADESKQADMTGIYIFLARLARLYDCAVVLNHHIRKRPSGATGKRLDQDDVIGSSACVRMAATVYLITQDDEQSDMRVVSNVKNWDKKISPFSYSFITDESGYLDFAIKLNLDPKYSTARIVASYLDTLPSGALVSVMDVAKQLHLSKGVARYHMDALSDSGRLTRETVGAMVCYRVGGEQS